MKNKKSPFEKRKLLEFRDCMHLVFIEIIGERSRNWQYCHYRFTNHVAIELITERRRGWRYCQNCGALSLANFHEGHQPNWGIWDPPHEVIEL